MRLYILGPAFGCPSVDAQCNAAVALVKREAERTAQAWELACAADSFDELPYLEDEGVRYHGFSSIAQHLRPDTSSAEQLATEAFVESNGQTLLDVSLYVSYENYAAKTRPSFTRILPWYFNYLVPPERRAAARKRTEHLGITGIDMDDVHESVIDKPESMSMAERKFDDETKTRARTLLGRRHTVKSMLRQSAAAGAFKLKNLANNFYEPLAELLEGKSFFGEGNEISRLDCLAFGYLSLLLYPRVPQAWAAEIMRKEYPSLVHFVDRVRDELQLHVKDATVDALFRDTSDATAGLPWTTPERPTIVRQFTSCGQALLRHLPVVPKASPIVYEEQSQARSSTLQQLLPHVAGLSLASIFIGGLVLYRNGIWPHGEQIQLFGRKRWSDYGAAGSALAVLGGLSSGSNTTENRAPEQTDTPRAIVDVQVTG
ncbi:Metaxin-like protein [Elsinoe fawcettii]|nr:Metaxin-like protein [Elsinoe fawcettii]